MSHQLYIVETCAKRQLAPLKTDSRTIQTRDYSAISLNAHQLTAPWPTLISIVKSIILIFAENPKQTAYKFSNAMPSTLHARTATVNIETKDFCPEKLRK